MILTDNGIELKNNSFEWIFFGRYKAKVTLHRLYPLITNKCYITLAFDSVMSEAFDNINLILKEQFGKKNYYINSHEQYWLIDKNYIYHKLFEDRLENLCHHII